MHKNRRITLHQKIGKGINFNCITSKNTLKNVSGIQNVIIYVGTVRVFFFMCFFRSLNIPVFWCFCFLGVFLAGDVLGLLSLFCLFPSVKGFAR